MHFGIAIATFLISSLAFAQGGPPLITDDPGTPGNAHWEINTALQSNSSSEGLVSQFPLFDINYGYGDRIQLNFNLSWVTANQYGSVATSGASVASLAVKWRFLDEDSSGVAVSTYPRVDFHNQLASEDSLVNTPGTRYFLPIEFSKEFGKLGVNPEMGYAYYTAQSAEWSYGLAVSYEFEKEKEVLLEVHGRQPVASNSRELLYAIGTRYLLKENSSLIGALSRSALTYEGMPSFWVMYLGIQLRI